MLNEMRGVFAVVPQGFLDERKKLGQDRWDEVWDGVLHVPPPPTFEHQALGTQLAVVLAPLATARGLRIAYEVAVFETAKGESNYRAPDLVIAAPTHVSRRGVEERAELVVEILSPGDEARDKLPFFAARGIPEVWLVEPDTREVEIYVLRDAAYFAVAPVNGSVHAPLFELELRTIAGPKLRITWPGGEAEI